jgi:hypothetical protein
MSLNSAAILAAVNSHISNLGLFERVNNHEPKNAPGNGLSCFIWVNGIHPSTRTSGLSATSGVVVLNARIQASMLTEPYDDLDVNMATCVDGVMASLSGDFDLGESANNVRGVDLLGSEGYGTLDANAGYLNQDNKLFRVMVITIPIIINDIWIQGV